MSILSTMRSLTRLMTAIIMLVFALVWVGMVSSIGAPWFFSLFGVLFVILAIFIILKELFS